MRLGSRGETARKLDAASEYSFAYVARWMENNEMVKAIIRNIQRAVRGIVGAVENGSGDEESA